MASTDRMSTYVTAGRYQNSTCGTRSTVEGIQNKASGSSSHAEGGYTEASGTSSHAEGGYTEASGIDSHAEGYSTIASGSYSHAEGYYTIAADYQHVSGKYNKEYAGPAKTSNTGSLFIIGNGTSISNRSNAFRIAANGETYCNGTYNTSGADYAEYFEWMDKNINKEDRVGLFVTLDGELIRLANSTDDYILGVVSATPSIIGDSFFGDVWKNRYLKDIFGRPLTKTIHIEEYIDEETKKIIPAHDIVENIINPDWDNNQKYISREDRFEWSAIGLLGKLIVVDDGTCEVNGYCKVSDNGIGTKSDNYGYRVMSRLDDTHIKILFR